MEQTIDSGAVSDSGQQTMACPECGRSMVNTTVYVDERLLRWRCPRDGCVRHTSLDSDAKIVERLAYVRDRLQRIEAEALLVTAPDGYLDAQAQADLILDNAREALAVIG
ncbi:MAG TPA: hypothetical protein VIU62_06890 [Chloroflexota bacterium]